MDTWDTVLREEEYMDQIHRRFSTDQVKNLFRGYTEGLIERSTVEETLAISRSRFFALLSVYRRNPEAFSIAYHRGTPRQEIHRHNHCQVHFTTGEIPDYRFEKSRKAGRTLFRPFLLPKPYRSSKDACITSSWEVIYSAGANN